MNSIRIALAQINPVVGDLKGNTGKIIRYIKKAKRKGAELVVFPELVVTGYPPEDLLLKPYFIEKNIERLAKIKSHCDNITAIVGFADTREGKLYNAAGILHNKKLASVYHKMHLPNYGVFDEKRYFTHGNECIIVNEGNIKWSVNICEDIWIEQSPVLHRAELAGAQLIINISASPYHRGKLLMREQLLKKRAQRHNFIIAYCNMVGGQDELVFDGGSLIVTPENKIIARGKQFEEDLVIADIELPVIRRKSEQKVDHTQYTRLSLNRPTSQPLLPQKRVIPLAPIDEVYKALALGLKDYIYKNRFKKVILGLSGGIDSALTSLIAVDSLGKENVVAVSMPSPYSSPETIMDTKNLAHNLGIKLETIPITEIFNKYLEILTPYFKGKPWNTTEENIQARIRGNILMAFSNKFGYLVLTTGNKSETSVGYCTLYGDMAGGFNVLKDVPKGLVYQLTEYRNDLAGGKLVPRTIFTRSPTAELRENQKDEDSLPPYPVLDKIIDAYVENDKSMAEIIRMGMPKDIAKKAIRLIDSNEYKRRQAPPGIKITPKAFGKDRRMPITHSTEA